MNGAALGRNEDCCWVFGYGSLMWRPEFRYLAQVPGVLHGFHRSFCVWSRHWRGTPERPGLVLGLAPGGQCQGVAFRVAAADWPEVKAYLDERELMSYAYAACWLPVELMGGEALVYEARRAAAFGIASSLLRSDRVARKEGRNRDGPARGVAPG